MQHGVKQPHFGEATRKRYIADQKAQKAHIQSPLGQRIAIRDPVLSVKINARENTTTTGRRLPRAHVRDALRSGIVRPGFQLTGLALLGSSICVHQNRNRNRNLGGDDAINFTGIAIAVCSFFLIASFLVWSRPPRPWINHCSELIE